MAPYWQGRHPRNVALAVPLLLLAGTLLALYGWSILRYGSADGPVWWYAALTLAGAGGAAAGVLHGNWPVKVVCGVLLVALMFLPSNLALLLGPLGLYAIVAPVARERPEGPAGPAGPDHVGH